MENLRKDVNYNLKNCSGEQLEQICDWLAENDRGWGKSSLDIIKMRLETLISCCSIHKSYLFGERRSVETICATTLFKTVKELKEELKSLEDRVENVKAEIKRQEETFVLMSIKKKGRLHIVQQPLSQVNNLKGNGWTIYNKKGLLNIK